MLHDIFIAPSQVFFNRLSCVCVCARVCACIAHVFCRRYHSLVYYCRFLTVRFFTAVVNPPPEPRYHYNPLSSTIAEPSGPQIV
jgi:hypothetical protein